jgi:hypothetical protein
VFLLLLLLFCFVLFFRSAGIVIKLRIGRPQKNFLFSRTFKPVMGPIYFLSKGRRTLYSPE